MHDNHRSHRTHFRSAAVYVLVGLACMTVASCGFRPRNPARSDTELGREWPKSPRQPAIFREASYGVLRDSVPVTEGAEYVNDDELCMNCHKVYAESMQQNVHRGIQKDGHACEACHGPASAHLKTRGKEPGTAVELPHDATCPGRGSVLEVPRGKRLLARRPVAHVRACPQQSYVRQLPHWSLQRSAGNKAHDGTGRGGADTQWSGDYTRQLPGVEHAAAVAGCRIRQHGRRRS